MKYRTRIQWWYFHFSISTPSYLLDIKTWWFLARSIDRFMFYLKSPMSALSYGAGFTFSCPQPRFLRASTSYQYDPMLRWSDASFAFSQNVYAVKYLADLQDRYPWNLKRLQSTLFAMPVPFSVQCCIFLKLYWCECFIEYRCELTIASQRMEVSLTLLCLHAVIRPPRSQWLMDSLSTYPHCRLFEFCNTLLHLRTRQGRSWKLSSIWIKLKMSRADIFNLPCILVCI